MSTTIYNPQLQHRRNYFKKIRGLFGANLKAYWPLTDASGAVATELVSGANGAYVNMTLAAATSPAKQPCPLFGVGSVTLNASGQITSKVNTHEGTAAGWACVLNSGVWSDGQQRAWFYLYTDANNRLVMWKETTSNLMTFYFITAGNVRGFTVPYNGTNWFHWALTWSESANRWRVFINGVLTYTGYLSTAGSKVNDTDAGFTYVGSWQTQATAGPYNSDLHFSNTPGDYVTYPFTGQVVTLTYTKSTDRGSADFYIDNVKVASFSENGTSAWQQSFTLPAVANGAHVLKIVVTAGPVFDVDAISIDSIPVWTGALSTSTHNQIGGNDLGSQLWNGYQSDVFLIDREMTDGEARDAGTVRYQARRLAFIGDSITALASPLFSYPYQIASQYNSGACGAMNHAVGGTSILSHLPTQVYNAALDDADVIIIALGTNDDNSGNMQTVQNMVEAQIKVLRASNPRAQLYYMNILPRWTDNTGATPVDKSNLRTAIAAACLNQGVTCWDTFTSPWIAAADTSDGLHPAIAGHTKITTQILARLP